MGAYFLISILIHASCVLLLLNSFRKRSQPNKIELQVVTIQNSQKPNKSFNQTPRAKTKLSTNANTANQSIPSRYLPKFGSGLPVPINQYNDSDEEVTLNQPGLPFGFKSGSIQRIKRMQIYQKIYEKIDQQLSYPFVLSKNSVSGVVLLQTRLLPNGQIDWANTVTKGGHPYLRIYVLRVLKTVFSQNKLNKFELKELSSPLNLDLSFQFNISSNNSEKEIQENNKFVIGQVLNFVRHHSHSELQWKVGPLEGLFPIPYVNLNVLELAEMIVGTNKDEQAEFISSGEL